MTTILPTAQVERMRLGKADGPPVGVVIKVGDRRELPAVGAIVDELLGFARARLAKARLPQAVKAQQRAAATITPAMAADLAEYFRAMLKRAGIAKLDEPDVDWNDERRILQLLLEPFFAALGESAFDAAAKQLSIDISFDLESEVAAPVRARLATLVTGVTETTRDLIRNYVTTANERGYSIEQLVEGVAGDSFLGLDAIFGSRAETIALTETATAYSLASTAAYRESGLVESVVVFDGPECGWTEHDDPDLADGSMRSLDEAEEYPTSHPRCQRAFGPVVTE